jgi:acetyl esterase/lipase
MNTTCDSSQYYTVKNPEEFTINWKAFYDSADELTAAAREVLKTSLDIPYGNDPKQQLDVYGPLTVGDPAPVLIFLHGGGMVEGDRGHYGYIAKPFAERGVVTVIPSYRLAPTAKYPSQPDDIKQVVGWVFHNIREHGGDPDRISISGHSAGAHLSSFVSVDTRWMKRAGLPQDCIKSCVPISGNYDFVNFPNESYLSDQANAREASPLYNIHDPVRRMVVAIGSVEGWVDISADLVTRLRDADVDADLCVLEGMDHDDTVITLGEDSELFYRVVNLL